MAESKIPWTQWTLNANTGCTECSPSCKYCYAKFLSYRLACMGQDKYTGVTRKTAQGIRWTGDVKCWPDELKKPLKRKTPTTYFVNSMSDLFHPQVPFDFVDEVFSSMILCVRHTFKILTKRVERMSEYINGISRLEVESERDMKIWDAWRAVYGEKLNDKIWPIPNVHTGVSICNQAEADEKIPILLKIPSAYRFISFEPLLEKISLDFHYREDWPDQIIIGCERKHGHIAGRFQEGFIDAAISLVHQADAAGVNVHVKQIPIHGRIVTELEKFPQDLRRRDQ